MRGSLAFVSVMVTGGLIAACSLRSTDHLQSAEGGAGGSPSGVGGEGLGGEGGAECTVCDGSCADLMTSDEHCGLCNEPCASTCVQGACVIAEDKMAREPAMMGVSSNTGQLFYAGTDGGLTNLFTMPLGGGTPESLIALGETVIGDVFINATEVYAAFELSPATVAKGNKNDVANEADLDFFDAQSLSRLAGADITVCWTVVNGAQCTFDGAEQPVIDLEEPTSDVAVGNGTVFIVARSGKVFSSGTNAAAPPDELGTVAAGVGGIDVSQGTLYIAADDGIWTMPTAGGTATQLTAQSHPGPFDIVVDQGRIYVTTFGARDQGRLFRASVDGGPEEVLYDSGGTLVPFVEARNEYVYFSSFEEGRLYRRHVDAVVPP